MLFDTIACLICPARLENLKNTCQDNERKLLNSIECSFKILESHNENNDNS